jgi:hypothetical protein
MSVLSAFESAKEFLFKLPAWLRIAWIVWFIVTSVLIALTLLTEKTQAADARFSRIEERLEIISMKLDMLLHGRRELYIRLGTLNIPRPALDLHIGWVDAVMDTIRAASLSVADPSKAAAIFEPIMEPEALVNAVLRGAAVIQGITLTRSRFTEIGRRRPAYAIQLQLINNTQAPLSVIIVKGQVFENAARHRPLQNLVAAEAVTVTCEASESKIIDLPAYCLNRDLDRPEGREGRITPLKICFSFADQISLYRAVKARVT